MRSTITYKPGEGGVEHTPPRLVAGHHDRIEGWGDPYYRIFREGHLSYTVRCANDGCAYHDSNSVYPAWGRLQWFCPRRETHEGGNA